MSAADDLRLESIAVITALRRGTVPNTGLSRLAVGLEAEEKVLSSQFEFCALGSHPLSSPFPPAPNPSQDQSLFQ